MARLGDSGAYTEMNVKCILHADNVTDAAANNTVAYGELHGRSVLTEDLARRLFLSPEKMIRLSELYGVSVGTINDIRSRRTWRRATAGLTRRDLKGRNQWA